MSNRRDFVKNMIGGGAFLSVLHLSQGLLAGQPNAPVRPGSLPGPDVRDAGPSGSPDGSGHPAGLTIDNPYAGIEWDRVHYIPSSSHVHVEDQAKFDKIYHQCGLRHIPISNYYPSAPTYPIEKIRYNQYAIEQNFGLVYNPDGGKPGNEKWAAGRFINGPFHWNDILMKGQDAWFRELPPELQAKLPFKPGDFIFKHIPSDVIVSPNAEHHSFTNAPLHSNAIGSLYSSGNFDVHDLFKTQEHGYAIGTGLPWEVVFPKMLDQLLFADAGGITINHPVWSGLTFDQVIKMLDFDNRVLGIEVYNDTCATAFGDPPAGWAVRLWDEILKTGRKCFGFFVLDHTAGRGKNILLAPDFNEHACLKAYRDGTFFGALSGSGLRFSRISLQDNELSIALNGQAAIRIVTDRGEAQRTSGAEAMYRIPTDAAGVPAISYVRIEAIDDSSEQLFSQPIRFIK